MTTARHRLLLACALAPDPSPATVPELRPDEIPLGGRYRWERLVRPGAPWHGWFRVMDVPLLSEGTAGDESAEGLHDGHKAQGFFDSVTREWLDACRAHHAERARRDGWLPPLHVGHHQDPSVPIVQPAGLHAPRRVAQGLLEGRLLWTLYGDLLLWPAAFEDLKAGRTPYLSVEVHPRNFPVDRALLHGCALLSHQPPEYKTPILSLADLEYDADGLDEAAGLGIDYAAAAGTPVAELATSARRIFDGGISMSKTNGAAVMSPAELREVATLAESLGNASGASKLRLLAKAADETAEPKACGEVGQLACLIEKLAPLVEVLEKLKALLGHAEPDGDEPIAPAAEAPEFVKGPVAEEAEKKMASAAAGTPATPSAPVQPAAPAVDPALAARLAATEAKLAELSTANATLAAAYAGAAKREQEGALFAKHATALEHLPRAEWEADLRLACASGDQAAGRFVASTKRAFAAGIAAANSGAAGAVWDETHAAGATKPEYAAILATYASDPEQLAAAHDALRLLDSAPELRRSMTASPAAYVQTYVASQINSR